MNYAEFLSFVMRTNALIHGMALPMQMPEEVSWERLGKLMAYYNVQMYEQACTHWIAPTFTLDDDMVTKGRGFKAQFTLPSGSVVITLEGNTSEHHGITLWGVNVSNLKTRQVVKFNLLNAVPQSKGSLDGWSSKAEVLHVLLALQTQGLGNRYTADRAANLIAHIQGKL